MLKEKLVDFVPPLLLQLAEAKSRASTCDHGDPSLTTHLFAKMERAVRFMDVVSLRLEIWEREVQASVGDITKLLNDMFMEDEGNRGEGFQRKLQTVDQKVSDLKAHMTPPLVLPLVEEESSSSTLPPHLMTPSLPDVAPYFHVVRRYENLSTVLQKCLLSLCIFPKDAVINKRLLIYWWIGEGLAIPTNDRTAQVVGEGLFKELIDEGFITPIYRDHSSVADSYRVPPLIRDELLRLASPTSVEEESSSSTLPPHLMTLSLHVAHYFDVGQRYENLNDPVLQRCLLSLCIFPEDAVIKKRLLISWWIAEGLATPTSYRTAQEDGEVLFKVLIDGGFITPIYRVHNWVADSCSVAPLIRDELLRLAETNQGFRLHTFGEPIGSLAAPSSVCLLVDAPKRERKRDPELQSGRPLTTCFNVNRHNLKFGRGEFSSMKNMAVLQLGRWQSSARHHVEVDNTEFLESSLGSFKNLRYLSLQGISRIKELPASTGKLTNLMILDLRDCNNLERLPVEITMLSRLTHLDVSECYFLDHMPKGLDSLSELQVLKGFVVASSTSHNPPCRLGDLSGLERIRKLSIRIGRDSLVADGELSELYKFEALSSLTISWESKLSSSSSHQVGLDYLDHVSLPCGLEKLDLRCFPRTKAPKWLYPNRFWRLNKLYIRGGKLCGFRRSFPIVRLGLRVLRLRFLSEFHMKESELLGLFPALDFLEIHECKNMRSTARRIYRWEEVF